jgi:predicted DNA-binding transcriptional regulator YafY
MITMLQGSKTYSPGELAQELEVSRRTVFRDLNMLEMARIPYFFDDDKRGYRLNPNFFLPPVNLTLAEALAMLLLAGRLRGASRLPLLTHASRAAVKLEAALPQSIREQVGTMLDNLHASLGPLSRHEGLEAVFEQIASAIVERRVCRLVYISLHERKQMVLHVHPHRLIFHGRAWYLLAHSEEHGQARTFKLLRIRKCGVLGRTFPRKAEEAAQAHFGGAWSMIPEGRVHDVHVHFDRQVASNVAEVQWHPTQRVQWNDDGSLEFHVRVDGLGEILWWILGYGSCAEVMSPPALRKSVSDSARATANRYRGLPE